MKIQIHATCLAIDGHGVLLRGPSGSGKSDLALRLIDAGALLVADDRVDLTRAADTLTATTPTALSGLIEVRGMGIIRMAHEQTATEVSPVACVIDLVAVEDVERLPEPATVELCGIEIAWLRLDGQTASAAAKVRLAVQVASGRIMRADE